MFWRAFVVAIAFPFFSCEGLERALRYGQERLPAEPPLRRVETGDRGVTIDVGLTPGTSISQVIDLDVFQPLRPGVTPDEARRQLGAPTEVFVVDHEKHYLYRTPRTAIAIVETDATSSADGTRFKAYELRAEVGAGFQEKIAPALRRLIKNHSTTRTVRLASADAADPVIHLHVQDGTVRHVTAWPNHEEK